MAAKKRQITWAEATRDIVLRLIATGQLPVGIFGAVVLLMVYRTPSDQMGEAWAMLEAFIDARSGLGYLLSVLISGGWVLHARFQRRNAERELKRMSIERTSQQQGHFKDPLESSEK